MSHKNKNYEWLDLKEIYFLYVYNEACFRIPSILSAEVVFKTGELK